MLHTLFWNDLTWGRTRVPHNLLLRVANCLQDFVLAGELVTRSSRGLNSNSRDWTLPWPSYWSYGLNSYSQKENDGCRDNKYPVEEGIWTLPTRIPGKKMLVAESTDIAQRGEELVLCLFDVFVFGLLIMSLIPRIPVTDSTEFQTLPCPSYWIGPFAVQPMAVV
ncbi:hypothetical protein FF38_02417 [Lucilia cuprina]|uniref:Uncharacterized protein n=1 Tax=Lucilia cuprina TaxID=7375 RepID=A0A0L0CAJ1_LUCCU|nr:hypothetical protein FF38_02417 [Lucilia cuprina]